MDVTTFDTRITREPTESIRSSLAAYSGTADGSAFVEHLLQEPIDRRAESPESSASPEERSTDVADRTDARAADSDASSEDDEDTSHDVDQDDTEAATASALASQTADTATTNEPAATTVASITGEPQPAATAVIPTATDQPSATDQPPLTDKPSVTEKTIGGSVPHTDATSAGTAAPALLAAAADGDPRDVTNATSGTGQVAGDASQTGTPAITPVATATAVAVPIAAAPNIASAAPTTETTEKPTSLTKTRNEKTNAKGRATSGKNSAGDATADTASNSAIHTQNAPEASQANPAVELTGPKLAVDTSSQIPATVTMGNEATTSGEANTRSQSLTERLPEQIFGRSSSATGNSDELSSADQMRLIQRVARAIEAAPQNGGILRLRLRPPELGAVRLEVAMKRGKMTARIETETSQARNVLLDQLPQLRERLEEQGIQIERFDVEVGPQDHGDSSSRSSHTEEPYRSPTSRGIGPRPTNPK